MAMNPDDGHMEMITDQFSQEEAEERGYDVFKPGELIKIRSCYFIVNNFVKEGPFMNLKLISKEEAVRRLQIEVEQEKIKTLENS